MRLFAVSVLSVGFLSCGMVAAEQAVTIVNIEVVPFASLEFDDPTPLLYLEVPPSGSTIPWAGVAFTVTGNASASLSAEPDAFIKVPASQYPGLVVDPFLGKAVSQNGDEIGYDLELRFPIPGPNTGLPLTTAGPAVSPVVDIYGSGGTVGGLLHLIADPDWTAGGGLALPGLYEGDIILTLSAS